MSFIWDIKYETINSVNAVLKSRHQKGVVMSNLVEALQLFKEADDDVRNRVLQILRESKLPAEFPDLPLDTTEQTLASADS